MSHKNFVYPRYQPEKSRANRWLFSQLKYDGANEIVYVEPSKLKFEEVPKRIKNKNTSMLKSFMTCQTWTAKLTILVVLFCSIGCFYSVFTLSDSYFNYEQSTNIIIQVKATMKMTALSVCLYYPSLLNHSHPLYPTLRSNDGTMDIADTEKVLTLQEIFDMTPPSEAVISKCSYRIPNEFDLFKGNESVCNEYFSVQKYYTVQYICYRFSPKKTANQKYSFLSVRYSLIDPGLFYQVSMKKSLFENTTSLQPSTYNWNGYPKSRFSTVIKNSPKSTMNKKNQTLSHFYLSYYKLRNQLLPAPFETNCLNYHEESPFLEKSDCFDNCMRNLTIRDLNRLPFATVTKDGLPLKFVTSTDFENSTFEKLYRSFEEKCAKTLCVKNDCRQLMYVTTFIRREWTSSGLVFRVDTAQSPDLVTIFEPKSQLFDYLIDVFNCFSNWFGWSFMDFTKIATVLEKISQ